MKRMPYLRGWWWWGRRHRIAPEVRRNCAAELRGARLRLDLDAEALLVAVARERRDPQLEGGGALQRDDVGLADEQRLRRRRLLHRQPVLVEQRRAQRQVAVEQRLVVDVEHADLQRERPQVGDDELLLLLAVLLCPHLHLVHAVLEDLQPPARRHEGTARAARSSKGGPRLRERRLDGLLEAHDYGRRGRKKVSEGKRQGRARGKLRHLRRSLCRGWSPTATASAAHPSWARRAPDGRERVWRRGE